MRPEVLAAFVLGVLLPVLETMRRGFAHWQVDFATMLEDYVAGALLLAAGFAAWRARPRTPLLLPIAWAYVTGMMTSSLLGQIAVTRRGVELEPNNPLVLGVKLALWGTAVTSLILSARGIRSADS